MLPNESLREEGGNHEWSGWHGTFKRTNVFWFPTRLSLYRQFDPEREYVKRVEVDPITNTLSLYIEKFPSDSSNKLCATFDARRIAEVKDAQDVPGRKLACTISKTNIEMP